MKHVVLIFNCFENISASSCIPQRNLFVNLSKFSELSFCFSILMTNIVKELLKMLMEKRHSWKSTVNY